MESSGIDNEFVSTKYGALRVVHFALCIVCLILEEVSNCFSRDYRLLELAASYGLIFSILVLIMFFVKFNDVCENYINLPLTLAINEIIISILFLLGGITVLMNLCGGGAKIGGILTGIFSIITSVTFAAAARLSYDWFATGSPSMVV